MVQGSQLTGLDLNWVKFETLPEEYKQPMQEADRVKLRAGMAALLQRLPGLIVLNLDRVDVALEGAQQLSAMTCLQDLTLQLYEGIDSSVLLTLPASITKLDLHDSRKEHSETDLPISRPSLPTRLQQLTAIQHLKLEWCAFPPTILEDFTQLQHLELVECALLPAGLDDTYHNEGTTVLLAALRKMMRLQHLFLDLAELDTVTQPLESYAAFTASAQLTELHLRPDGEVQPLRPGALQHMFPAGKRMPLLQKLTINCFIEIWPCPSRLTGTAMDSQHLARIISCCPNLQDLDIRAVLSEESDFSVLLQLPQSCTHLEIGGWGLTDAAAPVVAQLTQLQHLVWSCSPGLTDSGLVQLTALELLTHLKFSDCKSLSKELETKSWGGIVLASRQNELEYLCGLSPVLNQQLPAELPAESDDDEA